MTELTSFAITPSAVARATTVPSVVSDADLDAHNAPVFALGTDKSASHLLFAHGELVKLPTALYSCRARFLAPDKALVWGAMRPPRDEMIAWIVRSDGSIEEAFSAVRYCADAFSTIGHIVLTYFDDAIGSGDKVAAEGLATFDRSGTFLWGWNSSIGRVAPIGDCDAAVSLGAERVGVFASYEFPLVVLELTRRQPVTVHHPTPGILHGAHAISMHEGVWYFVSPYEAKNAILSWHPDRHAPEVVGQVPERRRYRGLQGGRFISITPDHAEVLTLV